MIEQNHSATRLVNIFKNDASFLARLKQDSDPIPILQEAAVKAVENGPEYLRDKTLYRIAVSVLGSLALLAAIGSIVLVAIGKQTPEVLVALGSAAVGALVGLFAPSPTAK